MNPNYDKLVKLLGELFQYDRADLDFGIYRIMNQKREEITRFLERDLLPQVRSALEAYQPANRAELKAELDKMVTTLSAAGVDPASAPKVQEMQAQYSAAVDLTALENQVFSDLYNFFRRYYSDGDFLSLRRYKEGVYAIPYEGEEVKLHWANADQYYIKSSENFRDYAFRVPDGRRVHFKLTEADTERDNTKAQAGKERRFVRSDEPPAEENGELIIRFEYCPHPEKQAALNEKAAADVLKSAPEDWRMALATSAATEKNPKRTLLEKHLGDYTARNSFDYFIHKDLGGFLRRELDFFIKNEVMHLDDIEHETAPRVEQYLSRVKVLRAIARKIIAFLEQLENFQKKLWLKKKFVVETGWCATLDRVPEELYEEIAVNDAQRAEWVRLFAIDEIEGDTVTLPYSNPMTVEFLKTNQFLVLDTKFFSTEFTERLLASFDDIEEACDGLLVHGENFQALNLLMERYRDGVKCIYIDPPYNTGPSEILYKNNYKKSSWLSLMENRLSISKFIMDTDEGVMCVAIDDYEVTDLTKLLELVMPDYEIDTVIVNHHPQGAGGANISRTHEYAIFIIPTGEDILRVKRAKEKTAEQNSRPEHRPFMRSGTADNNFRIGRPNSFYAVLVDPNNFEIKGVEPPPSGNDCLTGLTEEGWFRIYPISQNGAERVWRLSYESAVLAAANDGIYCSPNLTLYQIIKHERNRVVPFSNWTDKKYNAGTYGTNMITDILGEHGSFSYPKSVFTVLDSIDAATHARHDIVILDFFAGSGTTAHAVINLNREDNGSRKYILIEMGEYFDKVTKPRVQKVIYSRDWKDGKPISRYGSSHMFKYIRLESYEDTLNNLKLLRTDPQTMLLEEHDHMREDYTLHYMLDVESRGSLLSAERFVDPFNCTLEIAAGSVGETRPVVVDLVETFNYLIGLRVRQRETIRGFRVLRGTTATGERTLVIWRNTHEKTSAALDEFFMKQAYNTRDLEFDVIYVNGDNNLENLRRDDETWKVRLIEEEFGRRMFEGVA